MKTMIKKEKKNGKIFYTVFSTYGVTCCESLQQVNEEILKVNTFSRIDKLRLDKKRSF